MSYVKRVNGIDAPLTPEEIAERQTEEASWDASRSRAAIFVQIAALEATVSPRRLREAVRGTGKAWLDNVDDQIEALRAQLTA